MRKIVNHEKRHILVAVFVSWGEDMAAPKLANPYIFILQSLFITIIFGYQKIVFDTSPKYD